MVVEHLHRMDSSLKGVDMINEGSASLCNAIPVHAEYIMLLVSSKDT